MTTEEKMIAIFKAILIHINGYSNREATDEVALDNEGSHLWTEIEEIIES